MTDLKKYESHFFKNTQNLFSKLHEYIKTLSKNTNQKTVLEDCHRVLHTIKGSAALMGCENLSHFAEQMEENFRNSIKNDQKIDTLIFKELELVCVEVLSTSDFESLKNINFKK